MRDMELKEAIDQIELEEWLDSECLDYKRVGAGENLQLACCPFCGDDRSRVYFSRTKKVGICFHAGCPKGRFNLFSFAREVWGTDNASTAGGLIRFAGGSGVRPTLPALVCDPVGASPAALELPEHVPLPAPGTPADVYLTARGVLASSQERWRLQWSEKGVWRYADVDGKPRVMNFTNRILLPVHDLDGELVTFQGRDVTGETELRYLFPPSLPSSGRYLYGAHLAVGAEHLVMGEGPFDVIAIDQAILGQEGFRNAAAIGSFGLSVGHGDETGKDQLGALLRLKAAGAKKLTFLWDGEKNALDHALPVAELLAGHGFEVRLGLLPKDKDPAEVETRIIRETIQEAKPFSKALKVQWSLRSPYS